MSRGLLNINAHDVVLHTQRLEKLSRSALPNAVRGTLNDLAYKTKTETMPKEAKRAFVNRSKNFFKSNSRYQKAQGWDLNKMASIFGFINSDKEQAIEDLEKQESGGIIKGRAFIPMKEARVSKNVRRNVSKKKRITKINNVVRVDKQKGGNHKQRVILASVKAKKGGHILTKSTLYKVVSTKRKGRNTHIKLTPLYSYKEGRTIKVKPTKFMKNALDNTMKDLDRTFIRNAERQIKRLR